MSNSVQAAEDAPESGRTELALALAAVTEQLRATERELDETRQELQSARKQLRAALGEPERRSEATLDVDSVAMADLRQSEAWSRLLVRELQHRVRNTLAVVRSIAQRSAQTPGSKDEFVQRLDGRLAAFARVQANVARDPGKGLELAQIVADELQAHGTVLDGVAVALEGPTLLLRERAAELIGLAVHELTTNALKHGALGKNGRLSVHWAVRDDMLCFDWTESGVPIPHPPARRGFGSELLTERIAYELEGQTTLAFGKDGLRCTIVLPLSGLTEQRA